MKVLFVGATGVIGRVIVPLLAPHFELQLAAVEPGEIAGIPVGGVDIRDFEATCALVQESGADAVVNCAIADYKATQGNRDPAAHHAYNESMIDVNVRGAFHLYEAAVRAKTSKFVFISTMYVAAGMPRFEPSIKAELPQPMNFYACTKAFGEHAGAIYAARSPMSVTCLRVGHPYPLFDGLEEQRLTHEQLRVRFVHMEDIAAGVRCAIGLTESYGIYPVVSDNDVRDDELPYLPGLGYVPRYRFSATGAELIDG